MSDGGGAAVGCLAAWLGLAGACSLLFGAMWDEWAWLKGLLMIAAAFAIPWVVARIQDDP